MTDDYEYFSNKRTDRVYLSKTLENKTFKKNDQGEIEEFKRPFRIVSKSIDCKESHSFFKDGKEVSLRITPGQKQEIKAKFYEDTRGVFTLTIQKYTVESGSPHNSYFTFINDEISILYNFLRNIELLPLKHKGNLKLDDKFIEEIVLSREQAQKLITEQPELIKEILENEVTSEDVAKLGYRKAQLEVFNNLLNDETFFEKQKKKLGKNKRNEDVWQNYFEKNTWIFGYGLSYFLNSPLDDKKLEQITRGHSVSGSGKRVDALMKTLGIVSALSFGEIKTHKTPLLEKSKNPYREECWQISKELSGGMAQIQKTVQLSLRNIQTKLQIKDREGNLTSEELYLYQPKSFLIIGSLSEFETANGINEDKYSSFELFRKNTHNPEIITFDELYERAKYIIEASKIE